MQLQSTTNCAFWFLAYLSDHKGVVPTRDLTRALGFSKQSIVSSAVKLKEKGYIQTVNGPFGGYMLCKPPSDITVQEILELYDDEVHLIGEKVPQKSGCIIDNLKSFLIAAEHGLKQTLCSHTLADLMEDAGIAGE